MLNFYARFACWDYVQLKEEEEDGGWRPDETRKITYGNRFSSGVTRGIDASLWTEVCRCEPKKSKREPSSENTIPKTLPSNLVSLVVNGGVFNISTGGNYASCVFHITADERGAQRHDWRRKTAKKKKDKKWCNRLDGFQERQKRETSQDVLGSLSMKRR
jgi:hypothetical protein